MRAAAHLTHQALLLHLASELAQSLLELLRILDDYLQVSITPFLVVVAAPGKPKDANDPRPGQPTSRIADARPERPHPETGASVLWAPMRETRKVRTRHAELTLEDIGGALPGTGEIMASVSSCYAMCWHAADGGNWELAAYYLRRTRSLLRGLAVTRPKYHDQIQEYDTGVLEKLYQALLSRDRADFEALYRRAVDEANGYHVTTGHAYIRWARPVEPPEKGLDLHGEAEAASH